MYLLFKALVSGAIIAVASELARRSSLMGAILISLPLSSILAASLSWSILWVVVPSLVFFAVFPAALRGGVSFWPALAFACVATGVSYAVWIIVGRRLLGIDF